ncbi:hypothetical protein D1872_302940 [compost metagenome]
MRGGDPMTKRKCGLCGELRKMAGIVPLPKTGDIVVCQECLDAFKAEFKLLASQGKGRYVDLEISRPRGM